jgi:hypothetical protein
MSIIVLPLIASYAADFDDSAQHIPAWMTWTTITEQSHLEGREEELR